MLSKPRILFLSHGGGPLPLLWDEGHREMVGCLKEIAASLQRPSAIIVISAHWEEEVCTITSGEKPSLLYDYYGFPEESYTIKYPCAGEPVLARHLYNLLAEEGLVARLDDQRGFDHGLFVPLKIMYPESDIPCIQLSLVDSLNPTEHLRIGKAFEKLAYNNVLVIGSGFSFHNMKAFFTPESDDSITMNESFEEWLLTTCSSPELDEQERTKRLVQWEAAPFARYCHPREEHLLPLHVCYGIAQTRCSKSFVLRIMNKKSSMYLW